MSLLEDTINFSLRPNKAVERKLIFEFLVRVSGAFSLRSHRYIGLGSIWFVDFVMAHKILGISDMISIEEDQWLAGRAEFNRPYSCVRVIEGHASHVLPTLPLNEKPALCWMDYVGSIEKSVLDDLSLLCGQLMAGSVVLITLNAHKDNLPKQDADGHDFADTEAALRFVAGDAVPSPLPTGAMQASKYPVLLATMLFAHAKRAIRKAGRSETILPFANIRYKDAAPMLTVGFVIVDERLREGLTPLVDQAGLGTENAQLDVGVPQLTMKEKAVLDVLMPRPDVPSSAEVERLGFKLKPSHISAYHHFYKYYPIFGELVH